MTSGPHSATALAEDSVIIAIFDGYWGAEHMVASLGAEFRRQARRGGVSAVVVRGNADGSLKVTESRVLEAGDFASALIRISLSWVVGFLGLLSIFKGARSGMRAAQLHSAHAGSGKHGAHEILADAGPHAAVVLVRCKDHQMRQKVTAGAKGAKASWSGPLADFLSALDPGPVHDWARAVVGEHSRPKSATGPSGRLSAASRAFPIPAAMSSCAWGLGAPGDRSQHRHAVGSINHAEGQGQQPDRAR